MSYPCKECIVSSVCEEDCYQLLENGPELLKHFILKRKCPDCGHTKFICASKLNKRNKRTAIKCKGCKRWFFISFVLGGGRYYKVGKSRKSRIVGSVIGCSSPFATRIRRDNDNFVITVPGFSSLSILFSRAETEFLLVNFIDDILVPRLSLYIGGITYLRKLSNGEWYD
jgi:hypothetical protein